MLNLVRPKFFIPVHGEYGHHVHHAQLAKSSIPSDNIFIAENGRVMEFSKNSGKMAGRVTSGKVIH